MNAMEGPAHRFAAAVSVPAGADVRLDVAALCIAAHAHPGLDVDEWCDRLDELAAGCDDRTFEGLRTHLFGRLGFRGNADDYSDPENSFLDTVLVRRTGIPITLSLVMMEVGRRIGVDVIGVGMPGHFLVQDASRAGVWCDPFHGGRRLDLDGCRALFNRLHGTARAFHPGFLAPATPCDILARMLTNLEHGRLGSDPLALAWMCQLHLTLPNVGEHERARLSAIESSVHARWN
jgi:regulator of sirC expression with transglutaminase-like and TPR domain